jgi:hypothetical protein
VADPQPFMAQFISIRFDKVDRSNLNGHWLPKWGAHSVLVGVITHIAHLFVRLGLLPTLINFGKSRAFLDRSHHADISWDA